MALLGPSKLTGSISSLLREAVELSMALRHDTRGKPSDTASAYCRKGVVAPEPCTVSPYPNIRLVILKLSCRIYCLYNKTQRRLGPFFFLECVDFFLDTTAAGKPLSYALQRHHASVLYRFGKSASFYVEHLPRHLFPFVWPRELHYGGEKVLLSWPDRSAQ